MKTPLSNIQIISIYKVNDKQVMLPKRLALCTPDTHKAILNISEKLKLESGDLVLSDLFRNYDMQYQAHLDWKTGKKRAYSPPPGGSLHEAGRAMDIDLKKIKVDLKRFWEIAAENDFHPIIDKPDKRLNEAWHFDKRASHHNVYEYYRKGKAQNFKPYTAMAISAILAVGIKIDSFGERQNEAIIQSGLIRLGFDPKDIDGQIGKNTKKALAKAGIQFSDTVSMVSDVEDLLQTKFPDEFIAQPDKNGEIDKPKYII